MSVISSKTQRLLTVSMLKGIGPAALRKVSLIPGFSELALEELAKCLPQIARVLSDGNNWQTAQTEASKQLEDAERYNARIISPVDGDYPRLLSATQDDPFILYVKGSLSKTPEKSVAIIGTREPTAHGKVIASRITHFFAEQGWSIVSGLAIGCDAIAHQTALDAGAHTVAVLAHGLHMIAPTRHKSLAQNILSAGGALVSEYPFGQDIQNKQYVKRDRTQAGMSQGVVMIQSDSKGGSLHASRASLSYKRWLAVPYPTERDRQQGEPKVQANLLIAEGNDIQRSDLLRCSTDALKKIIILRSREDYLQMTKIVESSSPNTSSIPASKWSHTPELSFNEVAENISTVMTETTKIAPSPPNTASTEEQKNVDRRTVTVMPNKTRKPVNGHADVSIKYRLVINTGQSGNVKIQQILLNNSKGDPDQSNVDPVVGGALAEIAARLRHLQMQLDAINSMSCGVAISELEGKERRLLFTFSAEDMLTQMKRVINRLNSLDLDNISKKMSFEILVDKNKLIQASIAHKKSNFLEHISPQNFNAVSLIVLLDRLLDSSPHSVIFDEDLSAFSTARYNTHQIQELTDFSLNDLVCAFNELLVRTIYSQKKTENFSAF